MELKIHLPVHKPDALQKCAPQHLILHIGLFKKRLIDQL